METTIDSGLVCPKCHQPIDGDEAYICCANATLSWRCTDCGKVSEGFAFPYGLCPLCSGKLELLNRTSIEDEQALHAVRLAFEIELGGQAFYARAAAQTGEPVLHELFGKFADMEGEHIQILKRRYHAEVPTLSREFQLDRAAVFAGLENRPDDPANLLRMAIQFEQRAVDFFSEQSDRAPDGSVQKQLYKELAAEEREHVALLTTEYERWKLGKPGLL